VTGVHTCRSAAFSGRPYDALMAPAANEPKSAAHRRWGLARRLRATARGLIPKNEETNLVAHHQNEALMEESGRGPIELGKREAALLGYIKAREA
jgi:hypothetical protein